MSTTILVLDDDTAIRNLLCEVLQDEGFRVVAAESLSEILKTSPKRADLLITDLLLGSEMVGIDAITHIRHATQPDLPAIICTAGLKQSEDRHVEITRLGAHLLLKPFTIDELLDVVNQALKPSVSECPPARLPLQAAWA